MRILILALVAYIAAVVSFWRPAKIEESEESPEPAMKDREARDGDLSARLSEAAITFGTAAKQMTSHPALRSSIEGLSGQCAALAARAAEDEGFVRRNRAPILRLLFPLYGVVRRVTDLSQREASPKAEDLLSSATDLIGGAADALSHIAERADDTALRHLEADLEILEERLTGEA